MTVPNLPPEHIAGKYTLTSVHGSVIIHCDPCGQLVGTTEVRINGPHWAVVGGMLDALAWMGWHELAVPHDEPTPIHDQAARRIMHRVGQTLSGALGIDVSIRDVLTGHEVTYGAHSPVQPAESPFVCTCEPPAHARGISRCKGEPLDEQLSAGEQLSAEVDPAAEAGITETLDDIADVIKLDEPATMDIKGVPAELVVDASNEMLDDLLGVMSIDEPADDVSRETSENTEGAPAHV